MDQIPTLRKKVDELDLQILCLLGERAQVCRNIGALKKQQGLQVRDAVKGKPSLPEGEGESC